MEEEKKMPRIFYGWWIMVGAALGGFVTAGGIMTITVAAPHIQEEFGWSLTMIMGVLGVGAVVTGLMGLLAGYLVDRIGPRLVAMIGAIVGAAGLMLVSLTTANTPWMWYVCLGFLGATGVAFGGTIAPISTLRRWFMKRAALVISVALVGAGLATVVLVPFVYIPLMESIGWQNTYVISGLIVLVGGCIGASLLRKDPESYGMYPDGVKPDPELVKARLDFMARGETWSVAEAIRNRNFWFLILAQVTGLLVLAGFAPNIIVWGKDLDIVVEDVGWVVFGFGMAAIIGRLVGGFISDWYMARWPRLTRKPMAYVNILGVLLGSILCASVVNSYAIMLPVLIILGFTYSLGISVYPTYIGDLFGVVNLPRLFAVRMVALVLIGAVSPVFIGYIHDTTKAFTLAFWIGAGFCVISLVMLTLIKQPQKKAVADYKVESATAPEA